MQGEVSKDLTVDIYTLDFPNNNFIVTSDHKVVKDLVGQRIDRRYRITPEGKFELLIETRYKPQGYTEEMLQSEKSIFEGNEIKLLN